MRFKSLSATSRLLHRTNYHYSAQDALGSVRAAFDDIAAIQQSVNYGEYGVPDSSYDGFAFTGEQRDSNGLQYHRARYYDPAMGVWASLDPLETPNRYGYVGGNFINRVDRNGKQDTASENCPDAEAIKMLLASGTNQTEQFARPSAGVRPPFGYDRYGEPIPYKLIRDFGESENYPTGLCAAWNIDGLRSSHCGVDFVSYSDKGLEWAIDTRGLIPIYKSGNLFEYDINTGRERNGNCPISFNDILSGEAEIKLHGPVDFRDKDQGQLGRKVFAMFDGLVWAWAGDPVYSLQVTLYDPSTSSTVIGSKGTSLEVRYVHLIPCAGANPGSFNRGDVIRKGQLLGCYAKVGSSDVPHLHIAFAQRNPDGSSLSEPYSSKLCTPADEYLNPTIRNSKYGFEQVVTRGLGFLPYRVRFGRQDGLGDWAD